MKRTLALITALLTLILSLAGCGTGRDALSRIAGALELDLSGAKVEADRDSHGGFHGDGVRFVVLDCSSHPMGEEIAANDRWRPLPVSENVGILLYGGPGWAPVVKIDDYDRGVYDEPLFPEVTNGWYYFYDRHDNARDPYSDANVLNRYSYNFTVAVYDRDTDTLYFCKLDT